jgi:hypothetical protein
VLSLRGSVITNAMIKSDRNNVITAENIAFLIDGCGSIAYGFGIFFGVLILGTLAFDLTTGFSDFGMRSIIFLLAVYFVLVFVSISAVALLRIKAIYALKKKNQEEYLKFLKSTKEAKHEILGRLV